MESRGTRQSGRWKDGESACRRSRDLGIPHRARGVSDVGAATVLVTDRVPHGVQVVLDGPVLPVLGEEWCGTGLCPQLAGDEQICPSILFCCRTSKTSRFAQATRAP